MTAKLWAVPAGWINEGLKREHNKRALQCHYVFFFRAVKLTVTGTLIVFSAVKRTFSPSFILKLTLAGFFTSSWALNLTFCVLFDILYSFSD
jgi:hypothetical protein